jgi:hypothetical protein
LEKLVGAKSFGGFVGHLVRRQAIFLASSSKLGLLSIVQTIAPAFLGCWALIALAFVTHFQHDDHPIFLNKVRHVEINIFLF